MLRLGVDVGGTFTDVVAIDAQTRELVARIKVPTTHGAPEGVAAGIVEGITRLLREHGVSPSDVAFIAHSTTQATNALLEGDTATVGVLGLTHSPAWFGRMQVRFPPVELAPGIAFSPSFAFAPARDETAIAAAVDALVASGATAIAASEPFGVDRPQAEAFAVERAREREVAATSGHDISAMYGLRARTRTAALNAAILPRMLATARMTAESVARAGITAPLMIMRSDGGVMDVHEIERRPILTMLSGPAAGVAGALLYENVTDGIFIEVGGTSADCAAIRAGQPQMRAARVGGHRTMLDTIDSRTIGIAGGSMARVASGRIVDVGPRSAHIAGCAYAAFLEPGDLDGAAVERFAPIGDDRPDYVRFRLRDGRVATVTPTCASNYLGLVPGGAFAHGNAEAAAAAFELLARDLGGDARELARAMLEIASAKVRSVVEELLGDYGLHRDRSVLVGGGGGAASILPYLAESMGMEFRIARDAEVISPIGVALALVRDVVERTIVDPTPDDMVRLRREAADRVIAAGASPERIEVSVEIDAQRNRVRAIASGATALVESAGTLERGEEAQRAAAARSMRVDAAELHAVRCASLLRAYACGRDLRVVDERAIVRLALRDAALHVTTVAALEATLGRAMEEATEFGDVGRSLPEVYVLHGGRIADLRGLASIDQARALANEDVAGREPGDVVSVLTVRRSA
jgi:N-methylhydantoinase A/oxoprolinase/acetone carboxylase beta subunit